MTGGGFESGSDYVAAKVSVDVDGAGIQTLREMSQEIDRLRTSTEAAARGSASFKSYLESITAAAQQATEAHRNLSAMLDRTADAGSRAGTSGGGNSAQGLPLSRSAPGAYVDPWSGMGAGMGGSRAPSPTDIQAQIDPTKQLDPYKYVNAQAGRYNIRPGDVPATGPMTQSDIHAAADRIDTRDSQIREQEAKVNTPPGQTPGAGPTSSGGGLLGHANRYSSLAGNIMNEMTPGSGSGGMGRMLYHGMNAVANRMSASGGSRRSGAVPAGEGSEAEGGGTAMAANAGDAASAEEAASSGGLGSMLAKGAGGVGIGLAGLAAFEKGGSMIQGYRNMGSIRGGGAAQGMGDEASIRTMALNPFLTTEQSRQIIMAGLTEGYSGKQFDSVTSFMADNLKNMNMSVADSVGLLRKNVSEGGQSIAGLGASLAVLKGMASQPGNAMSMPDMMQNFAQTSGALIGAGQSGGAASSETNAGMGVFSDDQVLKGSFNETMATMGGGSPMGGALLKAMGGANVPAGLDPSMVSAYMGDHGQSVGAATGQFELTLYQRAFSAPGSKTPGSVASYNALKRFMRMLAVYDPQNPAANSVDAAKDLVGKLAGGQNPFKEGQSKANAVTSEVDQGGGGGGVGELLGAGWRTVVDGGKQVAAMVTGNDQAYDNASDDYSKSWGNFAYHQFAEDSSPVMNSVVSQLGAQNVEVDSGGKWGALSGSSDQMKALADGSAKWRQKGSTGAGYTLSQTPSAGSVTPGGNQTNVTFNPAQVQITIDNQGRATASPSTATLTPNTQQANAGFGSATLNNPAPGNGYPDPIRG